MSLEVFCDAFASPCYHSVLHLYVQPFPSPLMQLSAQKGATCATMEGGAVGTHRPVTAHLDMEGISVRRSSRMTLVSLQPTHCDSNK